MLLAPFACNVPDSRGRRFAEPVAHMRTPYQRDRDRIVHCSAFRRLVYKTQVFLNHEGDLFRTRLTHSLEVAQLARSMARTLALNEDLVEAIALAHDLGHTPFGHAGQDALNDCMAAYGGFEHNLQSLRVVDELEQRYPQFDGLNLCFETREGILKHCSVRNAKLLLALEPGGVAMRFVQGGQPSLEAQLCNLADEIAYNAHDIDDGVRSGLICMDQLDELALFADFRREALAEYPQLGQAAQQRRCLYDTLRRMLGAQVEDVVSATRHALQEHTPDSVDAVRALPALVAFTPGMAQQARALKTFLLHQLYRHPQVTQTMTLAKQVIRELFLAYMQHPQHMQQGVAGGIALIANGTIEHDADARAVADYIAGMTDRFAAREHERLYGVRLLPPGAQ